MLDETDRLELLNVAQQSIARGLRGYDESLPIRTWPLKFLEPRATFTTLLLDGELRGCCGTIEPQRPLVNDVWRSAWASAYADARFWPVEPDDIGSLETAISVLTPLEPLPASSDDELIAWLRPGIDGLVLQCGSRCATFLPAVWESVPDPADFIAQLKKKGRWSPLGWPTGMTACRYGTETFSNYTRREEPKRDASRSALCNLSIIP
jgi:AmmeMemoRadiSam system protein A